MSSSQFAKILADEFMKGQQGTKADRIQPVKRLPQGS
jgi:hypothetical protein